MPMGRPILLQFSVWVWVFLAPDAYACETPVAGGSYSDTFTMGTYQSLYCVIESFDQILWYHTPEGSTVQSSFPFDFCMKYPCELKDENTTLTLSKTPKEAQGTFSCFGYCNSSNIYASVNVTIEVDIPCHPIIPKLRKEENITTNVGNNLTLSCTAKVGCTLSAVAEPIFKWQHGGHKLTENVSTNNTRGVMTSTASIVVRDTDFDKPFVCIINTSRGLDQNRIFLIRKEYIIAKTNVYQGVGVIAGLTVLVAVILIALFIVLLHRFRFHFSLVSRYRVLTNNTIGQKEFDTYIYADDEHRTHFAKLHDDLDSVGYAIAHNDLVAGLELSGRAELVDKSASVIFLCKESQQALSVCRHAIEVLPPKNISIIQTSINSKQFSILRAASVTWPEDVRFKFGKKRCWDEFFFCIKLRLPLPNPQAYVKMPSIEVIDSRQDSV